MQGEESQTDLGMVKVHKNVIASIASLAALEIDGVKRVGGDLKSGILQALGSKTLFAIKVDINKSEEVTVSIPLIIKYGFNIPETADKVQESVRSSLERMTNLSIKEININVQGIER